MLEACLANQDIKQGLVEQMQQATKDHEIKSTPSFVINGTETMRGALGFESFKKEIDKKLEESHATK